MANQYRSQEFPFTEHIDKRDIRNNWRLNRFNGHDMLDKDNVWPPKFHSHEGYSSNFPVWGGYSKLPMTQQTFTEDDIGSDGSSETSGGSNGSGRSKFTRGPRIHHIPILVESRDDSSGYSSDTTTTERPVHTTTERPVHTTTERPVHSKNVSCHSNGTQLQRGSEENKIPIHVESSVNHNAPRSYPQSHQNHNQQDRGQAQRSYSDQQCGRPQGQSMDSQQRKAWSQPPNSPTANDKPVQGSFVTRVRLNAPAPLVEGQSAVSAPPNQPQKAGKQKPDPRKQIDGILDDMKGLKSQVEKFEGYTRDDKHYRFLDEMLTRLMLKLDDVDTDGQEDIRGERKKAIKEIQTCISLLEERITKNEASAREKEQSQRNGQEDDNRQTKGDGSLV